MIAATLLVFLDGAPVPPLPDTPAAPDQLFAVLWLVFIGALLLAA